MEVSNDVRVLLQALLEVDAHEGLRHVLAAVPALAVGVVAEGVRAVEVRRMEQQLGPTSGWGQDLVHVERRERWRKPVG